MQDNTDSLENKVVLITGAAHRVGAAMTRRLHRQGMRIVIHYRHSKQAAEALQQELQQTRPDSVKLVAADLSQFQDLALLVKNSIACWGRLDALINNASSFYPTPIGTVKLDQWDDLMASNLKAPFFLAQEAATELAQHQGSIINIVDIHADKPLKNHPVYCMAKAGLVMMTKSLARELGPNIRVNAVAPGAILWPEGIDEQTKIEITGRTALKRKGNPDDIAKAVQYLLKDALYTTGQILSVDGGRSLSQ
ncbi:MAG: pteridine reductase [Gammaproteobacteria bacterium]|nr:pteridine reductase [Gammaproteobacteria bacterium]MDH5728201.1 pteridine reductase [Gammaproteobacteria bacterium]